MENKINLAVLGSTGSIGQQTLDVVRQYRNRFNIIGLAAGKNIELFAQQLFEFKPKFASCQLEFTNTTRTEFTTTEFISTHPDVDVVVIATPGTVGLIPTIKAIEAGKTIAIANKEVIVSAGEIITKSINKYKAKIVPIDSEHSAIWQCLRGERTKPARIILTSSGGPFYKTAKSKLSEINPQDALKHPTWKMGTKVTIDSATLMNKGMEVIEAHWLFNVPYEKIEVIIHPESFIHSMVEFPDRSIKAQMSYPDMRLPIQYALLNPHRISNNLQRMDFNKLKRLRFYPVDFNKFPCLKLAIQAGKMGGTYPTALSAADEIAVYAFLANRIKFTDIASIISKILETHDCIYNPSLEDILMTDEAIKIKTKEIIYKGKI